LRSIYQHFDDLEALFAAARERFSERVMALVDPVPEEGPLEVRLDHFVEQRARLLEAITPVRRAAILQEPFSEQLRVARDRSMAMGRAEVARVFDQELSAIPPHVRCTVLSSLDVASGWNTWDALRLTGHDPAEAANVMRRMLHALLTEPVPVS
jgi:AcrR family transcriptional regulator